MINVGFSTLKYLTNAMFHSSTVPSLFSKADIDVVEKELDRERSEKKILNDTLLSIERKVHNYKLDIDSLRLHVTTAERERNAYEQTIHATNARHLKHAQEEYESNEKTRKELMNHIITLRITVATMHAGSGGGAAGVGGNR